MPGWILSRLRRFWALADRGDVSRARPIINVNAPALWLCGLSSKGPVLLGMPRGPYSELVILSRATGARERRDRERAKDLERAFAAHTVQSSVIPDDVILRRAKPERRI